MPRHIQITQDMANRRNDRPKEIEWMGRSIKTIHYMDITDEQRQEIEDGWYAKPDICEVFDQLRSISKGGKIMSKVTLYYFNELMSKVQVEYAKWTMEELLKSKELVGMILEKIEGAPRVFKPEYPVMYNFKRCIQLGGKGYVGFPTQFPLKTVDAILERHCPEGGDWYDFSCGWGSRLIGALRNKVNYHGTDPNNELCIQLGFLTTHYFMATEQQYDMECKGDGLSIFTPEQQIDIRCSGSEVYHSEWEGSMDLCFSSPPYFNLEDYKIGNQSWKPGMSYKQWVDSYLRPTIQNCYRYLKTGGKFVCNIKNFNGLDLEGDVCSIASSVGMQYEGIDKLEQGNRILCTAKLGDSSEKCFVFVK